MSRNTEQTKTWLERFNSGTDNDERASLLRTHLASQSREIRIQALTELQKLKDNNPTLNSFLSYTPMTKGSTETADYVVELITSLKNKSKEQRQAIIADQLTICECQQKIELAITRWEEKNKSASRKDWDILNDKISTAKELLKPHASLDTFKSRFDSAKTQINKRRDSIGTTLLKVIEAILFPVAIIHSAVKGTLFHRSHGEKLTNELSEIIDTKKPAVARTA